MMNDKRYYEMIQVQERAEEESRWKAKCEAERELNRYHEPKAPTKRIWTETEIKELVQTNDKVLYGALKKLYAEQTSDEQRKGETTQRNGAGFNGVDSKFLSSVAEFLNAKGFLTDKQKVVTRKKLIKYTKQLTRLANT